MNKQELLAYIAGLRLTDLQPSQSAQDRFLCFSTPGSHAEAAWRLLREHVEHTLHWPVVLGDDKSVQLAAKLTQHGESVADTLRQAETIDPIKWMAQRAEADPDYYGERLMEPPSTPVSKGPRKYQWFSIRHTLTRAFHSRVHIALVPTAIPWEVAAYLDFGGWNECPAPHEQVAMHKYWFERWHAEPFAIAGDVVELHVRKPVPLSEAFAVAREQYVYAPDVVDQGTESIALLAQTIADCDGWYFWWD